MRFICLFVSLMAMAVSVSASALQWQQYGIPGTSVLSIIADEDSQECIVIGHTKLYRSIDKGRTWKAMPLIPEELEMKGGIFVNSTPQPTLLVAAEKGVYCWDRASGSWNACTNGLPAKVYIRELSLSGTGRVFLATNLGLYYSDNEGQSWIRVSLSFRDDDSAVERIAADTQGSVYVRFNSNTTIFRIEPDLEAYTNISSKTGFPNRNFVRDFVAPNPENPDQLTVVTDPSSDGQIYYSTDRGETWQVAAGGTSPDKPLYPSWLKGNPIVFEEYQGVYEFDLQQQSWSLLWMRTSPARYCLLDLGGNQMLLGSQSRGVWRSSDNGTTWTYSSEGMNSFGAARCIGVVPDETEILYVGGTHGLWKTQDDGKTWEEINNGFDVDENYGISIRTLAVDPFDSTHLIAGTKTTAGEASFLYYTDNGGQNWIKIEQGPEATVDSILFVSDAPGIILAGTLGDAIWQSTNNGLSFTRVADPDTFINIKAFGQEKQGRIFAGLVGGFNPINGYAYSDDQGNSWTAVDDLAPGAATAFAADPHKAGHIMFGSGSAWMDSGSGVFFSSNNGASWAPANTGIPYGSIYSPIYDAVDRIIAHPQTSGTYYLLMDYVGVFKTENDGASWQQMGPWERNARGRVLELSPRKGGTLFLGTNSSGVFFMNESAALLPGVLMLLLDE